MADEHLNVEKMSRWLSMFAMIGSLRGERLARFFHRVRAILTWSSVVYLVGVVLVIVVTRWCGERNWITGTLLYFPVGLGFLPLFVLLPLSFLFRRSLCWLHAFTVFVLLFGYQTFHWSFATKPKGKSLRVLTNNIGQRKANSVQPFLNAWSPDIVAFQEARFKDRALKQAYPGWNVAVHDEFAIVTRLPIKTVGYVPGILSHYGYAAAWFELEWEGKPLIVYNVHLPTPRPQFLKMRGHGFVAELIRGGGMYSGEVRKAYQEAMQRRVDDGRALSRVLADEKRPFIVLGDFNMPAPGYLYRQFEPHLVDAFAARGKGFGLTFPGWTRNPLSLFGPWLRIDYIFTSKYFRPLQCETEPRQDAQHLAVAAELEVAD
jgi:endonuclease/exonuclease/phosphatase family metal-dependent hydrolase